MPSSAILDRLSSFLIKTIIIFVPFYAFISVWLSSALGHFTAFRLWDDYLLTIIVLATFILLIKNKQIRHYLTNDWLNRLIANYILLTLALGLVSYINHDVTIKALFYALLVNLRFLIWFSCVRIVARHSKFPAKHVYEMIFYPLAIVVIFGLLQFFILPHNFLSHFGYGNSTYPQYTTINQNTPTLRIQSLLRGPNPFGVYLAGAICILIALLIKNKKKMYLWALLLISSVALYLTFSRSALIGLVLGIMAILFLQLKTDKIRLIVVSTIIALGLILGIGYQATKNNQAVQDVLFHHNLHSTAMVTSNQGHLAAFKNNFSVVLHHPLGSGPGTSGQASWYNTGHGITNPEDYYIQIGEETGWLGLILFISILILVGYKLWLNREDSLSLGLLGGLIAIALISLFSYTWSDDTLAFLWWGLAGIALANSSGKRNK